LTKREGSEKTENLYNSYGVSGPTGPRGLVGQKGGKGINGEKGQRGQVGPQGLKGDRGLRGKPACLDMPAEIALVVDRSGSMGSSWSQVKTWLEALVDAYEIDGFTRKGGLVVWSDTVLESATVRLSDNKNAAELKTAIANLPNPAGGTKAGIALDYTYSTLFDVGRRDPRVYREIVFISDGIADSSSPMPAYPTVFHNNNIRITAVALGNFNLAGLNTTLNIPSGDRLFKNDDIGKLTSEEFLAELTNCG